MPTMTVSYTPNELRELVSKALSVNGCRIAPGDIRFVISPGFPESKDPRERRHPVLESMTVVVKSGDTP